MKKFLNFKFLNISFWIVLILAYIIPPKESQVYGYPFEFFRLPAESYKAPLIMNSEFMILSFLVDVIVVFIVLNLLSNLFNKIKK